MQNENFSSPFRCCFLHEQVLCWDVINKSEFTFFNSIWRHIPWVVSGDKFYTLAVSLFFCSFLYFARWRIKEADEDEGKGEKVSS